MWQQQLQTYTNQSKIKVLQESLVVHTHTLLYHLCTFFQHGQVYSFVCSSLCLPTPQEIYQLTFYPSQIYFHTIIHAHHITKQITEFIPMICYLQQPILLVVPQVVSPHCTLSALIFSNISQLILSQQLCALNACRKHGRFAINSFPNIQNMAIT